MSGPVAEGRQESHDPVRAQVGGHITAGLGRRLKLCSNFAASCREMLRAMAWEREWRHYQAFDKQSI